MSSTPQLLDCKIVDVEFGEDVKVVRPANLYGCRIGARCFIGPFTEIQRNVTIGADCRIQSHSLICEFVDIGERCFIGHGVMFINDLFSGGGPARGDKSKWKPTRIRNIDKPGVYAGNPARLIREL